MPGGMSEVGLGIGVRVGCGVEVGGTGVAVAGTGVAVGGTGVAVGGTDVELGIGAGWGVAVTTMMTGVGVDD